MREVETSRERGTHALVVHNEGLFDAASVGAKIVVQVAILGADRETKHTEHIGRLRDLWRGACQVVASVGGGASGNLRFDVREHHADEAALLGPSGEEEA